MIALGLCFYRNSAKATMSAIADIGGHASVRARYLAVEKGLFSRLVGAVGVLFAGDAWTRNTVRGRRLLDIAAPAAKNMPRILPGL